jgi:hypothetical protein
MQRPKEAFAAGHVVLSTYFPAPELHKLILKAEHSLRHSATGIDESNDRSQVSGLCVVAFVCCRGGGGGGGILFWRKPHIHEWKSILSHD